MYSPTNTTTAFGCHNINVNFTKHNSNVFQMVRRTHFISHDDSYLMQLTGVAGGKITYGVSARGRWHHTQETWTTAEFVHLRLNVLCITLLIIQFHSKMHGLYNLRKISPGIQKLRSKWGHVRGTAEVRPCLCRKLTLLISRTMQNAPRQCVKNTAFIAKPGGTQVVESTTLETVTRHFRAKGTRKHQPKSTHLTAFGVIKFFDR
jgi:hypothetical protein